MANPKRQRARKPASPAAVPSAAKQEQRQPIPHAAGQIDTWLQRGSYAAQVGLFVITFATLFYVVSPLYQKALLDESIAQKQLQLEKLQTSVADLYAQVRAFSVNRFTSHAGAECSGLMAPPRFSEELEEPAPQRSEYAEGILSIDPAACLSKALIESSSLEHLSLADRAFLEREVSRISHSLQTSRQDARVRFEAASTTVDENPSLIGSRSRWKEGSLVDRLLGTMSPEEEARFLRRVAVDAEQASAAQSYADRVRSLVLKLNDLEWPSSHRDGL